ncbi:MAG: preprotein translocase subunit SecY [Elusimicrobia bacterium RIFCSPLOWO2_01_FULL_64_13]|nr:MAG: preprotein translocase subunit SecY [Elusimicrobia bacterium RIFCSPHIGHO2_01_FULL_64_10]OGR96552.1 MAG: preprotein translocase subunit SecY [Elusimicrobia bacterium RIFCSPLOWO2_01_FULL_64_13]
MIKSFADIFQVPELKKKVLFTLGVLAAYRLGAVTPLPGINAEAMRLLFESQRNTLLGFLDIFSGGALARFSIFSMGIMPYINASIIMSLLQGAHIFPYLDRLQKEGELGRKKINQITRYFTLSLAIVQSFGLVYSLARLPTPGGLPIVEDLNAAFYFLSVLTLVTGTVFVMWMGEQITEKGIGNGISLIIFTGIIIGLPSGVQDLFRLLRIEEISIFGALLLLAIVLGFTAFTVFVETGQRKIPVQYAKRVVGRRVMGGASTFLPIKVDTSGVIAVIFAVSILSVPVTIAQFFPDSSVASKFMSAWNRGGWLYEVVYGSLIIFFCYFYNSIQFNPTDLADNMKKWGGFIPGIRPGDSTARYIQKILERITLWGALFVVAIAILPDILRQKMNAPFFFGGTALLIAVGVALDTIGQIESHLIMRHYEGFMKQGRIKGRWFNVR